MIKTKPGIKCSDFQFLFFLEPDKYFQSFSVVTITNILKQRGFDSCVIWKA